MSIKDEETQVLRLDRSRTERAFKREESLWYKELKRMFALLEDHIDSLEAEKTGDREDLPLLSIAIFGSPGSGKTSLIKTFARRANSRDPEEVPERIRDKIYSLPVIRPNPRSKDDHFLYAFLATALAEDRKVRERIDHQSRSSSILSGVQQKFQEVSEYLQVLNETGGMKEDDPLGVSLDRLERHESDLLLRKKICEFIDQLANTFGNQKNESSLVLMPVDDADLSFDSLVSALDTYWRYLQHPRLVPVFAFTGRLAEELLRVDFEKNLTTEALKNTTEKLKEASSSLLITENMAIQYLSRLFPIRNRIRLNPAAARVLEAEYRPSESDKSQKKVFDLLKDVSRLLFGCSFLLVPDIRAPLRMVTLRRQIQIVDAMNAIRIEEFMKNITLGKSIEKSWGLLFDQATWTLLNSQRAILKEINVNFDDLYSWTPQGLRWVLLNSILSLDFEDWRELLNHWYYRSEDRRSQIISLLAANIFRPRMAGEEATGDDSDVFKLQYGVNGTIQRPEKEEFKQFKELCEQLKKVCPELGQAGETGTPPHEAAVPPSDQNGDGFKHSFFVGQGAVWFLRLSIGFYLPQVLALKGAHGPIDTGKAVKTPSDLINAVGWGLMSGPLHAVRDAVNNKKTFSSGMMFLDPVKFAGKIEENNEVSLLVRTWCFYGFEEGRPWAAVSLWRALGLLGRLLEIDMDYPVDDVSKKNTGNEGTKPGNGQKTKPDKKILVKEHLTKHLQEALVVGNLPVGREEGTDITFEEWKIEKNKRVLENVSDKLLEWLKVFRLQKDEEKNRIFPVGSNIYNESKENNSEKKKGEWMEPGWKECFVRRIHGESIMSLFFKELDKVYVKKPLNEERKAKELIKMWCDVLAGYWTDCTGNVKDLLMACPFLAPFGEKFITGKALKRDVEKALKKLKWNENGINGNFFDIPMESKVKPGGKMKHE